MSGRHINCQSIEIADGEYLTPAQLILMFGFLIYEAPRAPVTAKNNARAALSAILSAAAAGGFTSLDLLDTLMSRAERSARVVALATEAASVIGDANAFIDVMRRADISMEGGL
ncbi:hypothetical protein WS72_13250 [Burkholderia savannae]|uniref:Uncharacterized protein n=1 Tax=Burkholderia savannae TaxID=1637837 RepID=A0ABR5TFG2_9BURK|nr:hypothetical protein [Burkholderia savannae]KWZ43726.1 hypothetical protein WS72_13250 [Burkholderia savannae]